MVRLALVGVLCFCAGWGAGVMRGGAWALAYEPIRYRKERSRCAV